MFPSIYQSVWLTHPRRLETSGYSTSTLGDIYANQYLLTSKNRFMWIQEWHMQLKIKAYKAWKTI